MCNVVKVGIIDDDRGKIAGIRANLKDDISSLSIEANDRYNKCEIEVTVLNLSRNIDDIITDIRIKGIDCLIIDYKLNSQSTVPYNGTQIAERLRMVIPEFPFFILTSYEEDLFSNTLFDSYFVFDYDRYTDENDIKEKDELKFKIIQQSINYKNKMESWKKELVEILPKAGETAEVDDRILLLNRNITGYYSNDMLIPDRVFKTLTSSKMDDFLDKIEKILSGE